MQETTPPVALESFAAWAGRSVRPLDARHTVEMEKPCNNANLHGVTRTFLRYVENFMGASCHKRNVKSTEK
jgi:hypothetical protein